MEGYICRHQPLGVQHLCIQVHEACCLQVAGPFQQGVECQQSGLDALGPHSGKNAKCSLQRTVYVNLCTQPVLVSQNMVLALHGVPSAQRAT